MKVLITGGAGYVGSHCNKDFMERGIETVILDNMTSGHEEATLGAPLVIGDIGDSQLTDAIFEGRERGLCYKNGVTSEPESNGEKWTPFDAVIHFAALEDEGDSMEKPQKYADANVMRMRTLLLSMVNHGIPYCIFASSAAVFGEPHIIPMDEKHPMLPLNPYGETKLGGERLLRMFSKEFEFNYCILRYFNAVGADPSGQLGEARTQGSSFVTQMIRTSLGKQDSFYINGNDYDTPDGTCQRDFLHVCDIAAACGDALQYLMETNMSDNYNLGNSEAFSEYELIKKCEEITGTSLNYNVAERHPGDPAKAILSNEKAAKILKWTPKLSDLETIIKTSLNWEKNRRY